MPLVNIEMFKGSSSEDKIALMQVIHSTIVEILKVTPQDCQIKISEFSQENCFNLFEKPENHLIITIKLFLGRSLAVKRQLYQAIAQHLIELNFSSDKNIIVLEEISMENWGIRGGIPASEVKLDYKVNI